MGTLLCLYNCYTHLKNKYFTGIKKGYLSQTANLFVNLKSNTMKNNGTAKEQTQEIGERRQATRKTRSKPQPNKPVKGRRTLY